MGDAAAAAANGQAQARGEAVGNGQGQGYVRLRRLAAAPVTSAAQGAAPAGGRRPVLGNGNGNGHAPANEVGVTGTPHRDGGRSRTRGSRSAAGGRARSARGVVALMPDRSANPAAEMETHVEAMLRLLGEDPRREGLVRTPHRVAQSLGWLTRGYRMDVRDLIGGAVFEERHESMVLVRDIEFYSMCEHHMLPFFGKAHVAYVPDGRIIGLSKLPRIVEVFARRLQVQERLTDQIADAIQEVLQPRGVGVVLEASHLCMMMRGVEKQASRTVSSALRGVFRDCPMTRDEFLRLAHGSA